LGIFYLFYIAVDLIFSNEDTLSKKFFSFNNLDGKLGDPNVSLDKWGTPTTRVKFMHRGLEKGRSAEGFLRQFPGLFPQWGNCIFDFDLESTDYDWLVVYQDLPPSGNYFTEEKLQCPKEKTLLITQEPSSITVFSKDYINQFGAVLTFQEPWAMRHPNVIYHHPGLLWHYGLPFDGGPFITWDQMERMEPPAKTKLLSTVCSQRTGNVTLHSTRVDFTWRLKDDVPELDIYGHGVNPMNDKAEALDSYKFHIVVENHVYDHHVTEKLPDAFLGYTLPFYHGAPNTEEYFPKESFIPIDINDYKRSREIIRFHLGNNEYEDRLPFIIEARRRVLEEQNLFGIIASKIAEQDAKRTRATMGKVIRNRSTMRIKNPLAGLRSLGEKVAIKAYHRVTFKSRNKPKGL
jgi:hypothetical protein